jgi:hypothetical protein
MVQRGDGFGFLLEAADAISIARQRRGKHFDGDVALQARIACAINFAHPACTEQRLHFVGTELCAGSERHSGRNYNVKAAVVLFWIADHEGVSKYLTRSEEKPQGLEASERAQNLLHSGPYEPFTPVAGVSTLFGSRLRGRAVQRTSQDSQEFGAFCFRGRSVMNIDRGIGSQNESTSDIEMLRQHFAVLKNVAWKSL